MNKLCLLAIALTSSISSADTALYAPLAPPSFFATNQTLNYNAGYMFTPKHGITVTKLGGAFYGTKTVFLYDHVTGAVLRSINVTGTGTSYTYANISAITLAANHAYVVSVNLVGSGANIYQPTATNLFPYANNDVVVNTGCAIPGSTSNPCTYASSFATLRGIPDLQYTGAQGLACGEVTVPGIYSLTGNLTATSTSGPASNCIYLHDFHGTALPTTLDCHGYTITGTNVWDDEAGKGLLIKNNTSSTPIVVKNCSIRSQATPSAYEGAVVSSTYVTLTGSTLGTPNSPAAFKVTGSASITFTGNTINGMLDVHGSTSTMVKQNTVNCAFNRTQAVGILFADGSFNTAQGNIVYGNWDGNFHSDGSFPFGCDDGLETEDESYDTLTDNNVTNIWDVGIETFGLVTNSHFDHNIFSNFPYQTPGAGIGGWYNMGLLNNTFIGNVNNHTGAMFWFYSDFITPSITDYYFQGNTFAYNTLFNANKPAGQTYGKSDFMAGLAFPNGPYNGRTNHIGSNTFTSNMWLGSCEPEFSNSSVPASNATDGGSNVCVRDATLCPVHGVLLSCNSAPTCSGWQYDSGAGMGCWYQGALGQSCNAVCATHGGFNSAKTTHSGNRTGAHFTPLKATGGNWQTIECSSNDNNTNWGANGMAADGTFAHAACQLSCACNN